MNNTVQNLILIVDDNPTNVKVLFECLKSVGHRVLVAQTGESALEKVQIVLPDLILLDVMMPGINGFETCKQLKASPETQDIPIIFMTALSDTEEKVKGFSVGAVDYITKPFQREEVLVRVNTHLQLRNLTRQLEGIVSERTYELSLTLKQLQDSQLQLIQNEKMSSLGNLVAGVAHEINNPIGFISGNIDQALIAVKHILECLRLYQQQLPSNSALEEKIADIDLEYLVEDLPKMLTSMKVGCDRIRQISTSLRTFSRSDTDVKTNADIHEGIDSTLMILTHRLKANEARPEIKIIKNYSDIPKIPCYLGQLNQVFMNILANAIDSFEDVSQKRAYSEILDNPNIIKISTTVDEQQMVISIQDNGCGMSADVKNRIFDHLYTTKPVGKGTGLGLSICKQIIEEKHEGQIIVDSIPTQGSLFTIKLPIELENL
jgi:signal transduction histidine kinase